MTDKMSETFTEQLSEQEFAEALGADPRHVPAPLSPARYAQWLAAQDMETQLESSMRNITAPVDLSMRLLAIADAPGETGVFPATTSANESIFWQRLLPTAAILMLAIGIGWYYQLDSTLSLQDDLFGHLYAEEPYYPPNQHYDLADVNAHLETAMGAHLKLNAQTQSMDVTFVKDCLVAKLVGTHLVMQGHEGPVNIIMLPGSVVETETLINDDHFSGLVSPAFGRTLVVIGNKQETIEEYRNLVNSSLEWEY